MLILGATQAVLVARWLGPEGRGYLAMALLLTNIGALLVAGGAQTTLVFHVASGRVSLRQALAHIWTLVLASAGLAAAAYLAGRASGLWQAAFPGLSTGLLLVGVAGVPITVANEQVRSLFQGSQRTTVFNGLAFGQALAALTATVLALTVLDGGELTVAVALVVVTAVITAAAVMLVPSADRRWRPQADRDVLSSLWRYGREAHVATTAQFLNYRLDLLFVAVLLGPVEAGIYVVSLRLAELLWVVPDAAGIVLLPRVASGPRGQDTARILAITAAISTSGALALWLAGPRFIPLVFGDPFSPAFTPLTLLLPGSIALALAKVLTNVIAGLASPRANAVAAVAGLAVALTLNLLLIPRYGLAGAATATSVSYLVILMVAGIAYNVLRPDET